MRASQRIRSGRLLTLAAIAGASALLACQEDLTAPGICPEFCPEGTLEIIDTLLFPVVQDSAFRGFVTSARAPVLHLIDRGDTLRARAVIQFGALPDSSRTASDTTGDTVHEIIRLDSVRLSVTLRDRDTTATGLELSVYRLPPGRDSLDTFAALDGEFVPANLLASVTVDSQVTGPAGVVSLTVDGNDLTLDSTRMLAFGFVVGTQTGTAVATLSSLEDPLGLGTETQARVFAVVDSAGTEADAVIDGGPIFDTSLIEPEPAGTTNLEVGGLPTARSLLRLALPSVIIDSSTIVRATLFLVPTSPADGVPATEFRVFARALQTDLGRKSPLTPDTATALVSVGSQDTVALDIGLMAQRWKNDEDRPRALMLSIEPEGGSVASIQFGGSTTAGAIPSLRIVYFRRFDFGSP